METPYIPAPVRAVDLRPLPDDPERVVVVDRLGLQPNALAVPVVFLLVAQHFDGRRSAAEIAADLEEKGIRIDADSIQVVAEQLAGASLLADDRTRERIAGAERECLAAPRPARLAGSCYPASANACRSWIESLLEEAGPPIADRNGPIPGIVLPHIDPRLGGLTYARGYQHLLAAAPADLYVILGIGHAGLTHGINLTPVDFETPLGAARTDSEVAGELVARTGDWILADQLVGAREHSIECQVIFMRHLLGHDYTILPLLTSFGYEETERMRGLFATLRGVLEESGKSWTVLSSVDFSHVGPMYGDPHPAEPIMGAVESLDRAAIARLEAADDGGFWEVIHATRNPTRICGYSSMWGMLQLIEPRAGRLIDYSQTTMDEEDSRVTFAALTFE